MDFSNIVTIIILETENARDIREKVLPKELWNKSVDSSDWRSVLGNSKVLGKRKWLIWNFFQHILPQPIGEIEGEKCTVDQIEASNFEEFKLLTRICIYKLSFSIPNSNFEMATSFISVDFFGFQVIMVEHFDETN